MLTTSGLTFLDVELANSSRDSICELGIIRIEEEREVFRRKYLINPRAPFHNTNIRIHGITSTMVAKSPTFSEVWPEIEKYMTSGVIVAHNAASMDLCAITSSLERFHLQQTDFYFICTLKAARALLDSPSGYGLSALCDLCGFPMKDHHDALADADACMKLYRYIDYKYGIGDSYVQTYQYSGPARDPYAETMDKETYASDSRVDKALNELYGLIYGIGSDNEISTEEQGILDEWIAGNSDIDYIPQIKKCLNILTASLEDRYISAVEYAYIIKIVNPVEKSKMFNEATLGMQVLFGILDGISCDNVINEHELNTLLGWLKAHMHLSGVYPFDNILAMINDILADGIITKEESDQLIATIRRFTAPLNSGSCGCGKDLLCIPGKSFCLSGSFQHGEKAEIGTMIEAAGGVIVPSVTKKTDYVVVGGSGSVEWKFGNYGAKVSKALELQEKGSNIAILSETELFRNLGDR